MLLKSGFPLCHYGCTCVRACTSADVGAGAGALTRLLSYGWSESDQCAGSSPVDAGCRQKGFDNAQYINRTNFELQKVGLLGMTLTASSGDSGCHGRTHEECLLNAKMHPACVCLSPSPSCCHTTGAEACTCPKPMSTRSVDLRHDPFRVEAQTFATHL
jgi:hypothetical protein